MAIFDVFQTDDVSSFVAATALVLALITRNCQLSKVNDFLQVVTHVQQKFTGQR
jgi:hypothetical protein